MLNEILLTIGATFLALFPVVNPIGAIPVFCSLTSSDTKQARKKTAIKTAVNVFFILTVFLVAGNFILNLFGLNIGVLKIAGGLIVAHTAWEMLNTIPKLSSDEKNEASSKTDISFSPMALPMLSGPGAIGIVISLGSGKIMLDHLIGNIAGIFFICVICYIFLMISGPLFKILKNSGVIILNKIMGFFILAIAVKFIADGIVMLSIF